MRKLRKGSVGAGLEMREQNNFADRLRPGEQHDKAIDSHAYATGWRHAVLEGMEKIFVDLMLLIF